jgi:hypothetical protein
MDLAFVAKGRLPEKRVSLLVEIDKNVAAGQFHRNSYALQTSTYDGNSQHVPGKAHDT